MTRHGSLSAKLLGRELEVLLRVKIHLKLWEILGSPYHLVLVLLLHALEPSHVQVGWLIGSLRAQIHLLVSLKIDLNIDVIWL